MDADSEKSTSARSRLQRSGGDDAMPQIHSSARSRMRNISFEDSTPKEPILLSDKPSRESRWRSARKEMPTDECLPDTSASPPVLKQVESDSSSRSSRWRSRLADQIKRSSSIREAAKSALSGEPTSVSNDQPPKVPSEPLPTVPSEPPPAVPNEPPPPVPNEPPPPIPSEPPPPVPDEPPPSSTVSSAPQTSLETDSFKTPRSQVSQLPSELSRSTSVPTNNEDEEIAPRSSRRKAGHTDFASRSLNEDSLRSLLSTPISVPSHPLPPPVSIDMKLPLSSSRRSVDKDTDKSDSPSIVGLPAARATTSTRAARVRPTGRTLQTQKAADVLSSASPSKPPSGDSTEITGSTEKTDSADDMISQFQTLSLTNLTENTNNSSKYTTDKDSTDMTQPDSKDTPQSQTKTEHDGDKSLSEKSPRISLLSEAKLLSSSKSISEQPSRRSSRTRSMADVPVEDLSQTSQQTLEEPKDRAKTRSPSPRSSRTMSASDIILDGEELSPGGRHSLKSSQSMEMSQSYSSASMARRFKFGARVPVVTDLDQAAKDMDEQRLRAWFGDTNVPSKDEASPKAKTDATPKAKSGDNEFETDIDDDPKSRKFTPRVRTTSVESPAETPKQSPKRTPGRQNSRGDVYRPVNMDDAVKYPRTIPGKLDFSQMEVFEGQMLTQWLTSWFDESHYLHIVLTKHDLRVLIYQFCTHLLAAGVIKSLERQPQDTVFSPHCMYYWTHVEAPPPSQSDIPGRLGPMWPPQDDDLGLDRPSLKYSEAEHQAAMVQLRQDYKEDIDIVKKEHQGEIERCRQEYLNQIQDCNSKISALQQEVDKYRVLAGIEELTQAALSDANAAQREAGLERPSSHLTNGFTSPETDSGERMIVVTGTPQQSGYPEDIMTAAGSSSRPEPRLPPSDSASAPEGVGLDEVTPPQVRAQSMTSAPGGPPPPPPPPPPPGMGGPPPPPPPPPMPGGGPPPPPPPPGAFRQAPLKPMVSPKSPMKPLFWQRLQVHDIKAKQKEMSERQLFWEDLEEAKVDLDEFDEMFSKVPLEPKKKKEKPKSKPKKEVAKVLDAKRSQALGIFLSSLRMEMTDIETAILNLDTSLVDEEKLKTIYDMRPEDDEMKKIKKQLDKHPDTPLDKPEHFLYELSQVPDYSDRIFCFIFQSSFQESMSVIEAKLNNLKMTCAALISGKGVKNIFGLILALGNYMNGGSRTRGQADGFGLEILPKLRDVKGKDNRTSLLHYVVVQYVKRFEGDRSGTERVTLPIPDPSDISQAALVNFDELQKEIKKTKKDFDSAELRFEKVLRSDASKSYQQPFKNIMTDFFTKGKQDFTEQQENLAECQKKFQEIVVMFCMKPKTGESAVSPVTFFSFWQTFSIEFKDLWKKEQQRIVKQRIRDAETQVKKLKESKTANAIPKRAKKAGGLKDRLAQKGLLR